MTNYKLFKIKKIINCELIQHRDHQVPTTIRFVLDSFVFNDCSGHCIDCIDDYPFNTYQVGDYLEIDLDVVKFTKRFDKDNYGTGHRFSNTGVLRKVSSGEVVRGNNNMPVISMSGNEISGIVQQINKAIDSDERNEYEAKIHVDPNSGKYSGFSIIGRRK